LLVVAFAVELVFQPVEEREGERKQIKFDFLAMKQ
jgi:hypothetical protein